VLASILAILQAATALTPVAESTVTTIEAAFANNPVSTDEAADLLADLEKVAAEVPLIEQVTPIVQKQLNGETITDDDLETLESVSTQLQSQVDAKVAAVESAAGTGTAS
jgi:hypothetical protein